MEGLSAICVGLGSIEEDESGNRIAYCKGKSCLDNLKDLLRFLRRDDPETRDVFKQVCEWNIVAKDLIPIIEYCQDDQNLVLNAVKVLVFLTMPIEPTSTDIAQQIEYLWSLKSSITSSNVVAVIVSLLESPLENLECEALTEDDWKLVQLVLTFFRNVLAVQEISVQQKAGGSAFQYLSLRDGFLELLFRENVMDLILAIAQHVGGSCRYLRQDNLLLLEILRYIFMGQEPQLIAEAHQKRDKLINAICMLPNKYQAGEDTEASINRLKSIMEEEKSRRSRLCNLPRHSQFIGTFTRITMDGSKVVVKGKPSSGSRETLNKSLQACNGPKKKILWDHERLPSTNNKILLLLHDFVTQFLSGSYNVLMQIIREDIEKEHYAIQNSDILVFFQVAQFATSFQYYKVSILKTTTEAEINEALADSTYFRGEMCSPIAASMNESMFQLVISKWRYSFDGLKQTNDYKFLSAAGSLMKNMISMLDLVLKLSSEDSKGAQTARILLYKLFYDQTDEGITQFLLNLIKTFDTHKQPKSDLADLVEIIYKVLRLIEKLQARGTLRVSRKSRKGRKTKSSKDNENKQLEDHNSIDDENQNDNPNDEPATGINANNNADLLKTGCVGDKNIITPAQAAEPVIHPPEMGNFQGSLRQMGNKSTDNANNTADSSGEEDIPETCEVDFNVSSLISTFANNSIIHKICWLLKFYKSNSVATNHYIVSMLWRIAHDLELSPMLYQLSLLTTFYDIIADEKSSPCKKNAKIVDFLSSLVRKMLRKMKSQPLLFIEVLFWKTRRECHYINAEYLLHELGSWKKDSKNWDDVSCDGENSSSMAQTTHRNIADALGEDEADVVILHDFRALGEDRGSMTSVTARETNGKEHNDNRGQSMDKSDRAPRKRKRLVLDGSMEQKVKDLYEKYKDDHNCDRLTAEVLDPDGEVSPAQISNKLKQLGLKVGHKKRMRPAGKAFYVDDSNQPKGESHALERDGLHNSGIWGESLLSKPLHSRKRVCAFGEDEETKIRALYEQFKDHKRCNHLIANSLDADGKFTAAQVSRKLKQLGLNISCQKRSEGNFQLRDEDDEFATNNEHNSDDDALASLINRSKKKNNISNVKKSPEWTREGNISEDSDDEILGNLLRRASQKSQVLEAMESEETPLSEVGRNKLGGEDASVVASVDKVEDHFMQKQVDNDVFEDSGDEMGSSAYQSERSASSRRKLRMVVDLEDDD